MKKLCMLLLCCLFAALTIFPVLADVTPVEAEAAIPFLATAEEDFQGGILIVNMKHEYSYPNKVWNKIHFGNPKHVAACVDLTACDDPAVIASYQQNQHFRQILEVYLDTYDKQTAIDVANQFAESPYVFFVGLNHTYKIGDKIAKTNIKKSANRKPIQADRFENNCGAVTKDSYLCDQYGIFNIQANKAWAITKGSSNVTVGVIDTGIDPIPELVDSLVPGYNLSALSYGDSISQVDTEPYYDADTEIHHGTRIASIIAAAHNTIGIAGIAPNIKIMPLRIAYNNSDTINDFAMVRAFILASMLNLPIVNFSINNHTTLQNANTGQTDLNTFMPITADFEWLPAMMNYPGLIVNSAGNDECMGYLSSGPINVNNDEWPIYPGKFKDDGLNNILVVGSVNQYNEWAVSNWGNEYVDLMAPGQYIMTAYGNVVRNSSTNAIISINTEYDEIDGSSFSAPMVTATAALLLSYNPQLTVQQLKNIISNNVTIIPELANRCITSGVLNTYQSLLSISSAMYNYCITISAKEDAIMSADGITAKFPADQVKLTDVYMDSSVYNSFLYQLDINFETGYIHMNFANSNIALSKDTVIFEFWFAAPVNTITNNFMMITYGFEVNISNPAIDGSYFMLGDIGKAGTIDDTSLTLMDLCINHGSYVNAADINRDHIIDNADKLLLQKYLSGEIKTFF